MRELTGKFSYGTPPRARRLPRSLDASTSLYDEALHAPRSTPSSLPAGLIVRDHDIMYSHFVAPSRCQTVFVARASAMLVTQPPAHELATNSFDFAPRVLNLRACLSRQPLARPHLIVWRGRAGRET